MKNVQLVQEIQSKKFLFIGGKGGVGKTLLSQAFAQGYSDQSLKTLHIEFESPFRKPGEETKINNFLTSINVCLEPAFFEYMEMKIKIPRVAQLFAKNKLIQYLTEATPGFRHLILLGKTWHSQHHYDRIIVDMASTGYGIAMFHSTRNFATLFRGSPLKEDADAIHDTLSDVKETAHLIITLPEEMPLIEGQELSQSLHKLFPKNPAYWLVNRRFPEIQGEKKNHLPLFLESAKDYAIQRSIQEKLKVNSLLKNKDHISIPWLKTHLKTKNKITDELKLHLFGGAH
ncbi:MAG: hypothetical protein CL678_12905 [Bdellovibrionaceae bacterium]|nr:hypothetical protein [Pseudobdellovibrionaceae bacterium]